jgi:hypothetical protein
LAKEKEYERRNEMKNFVILPNLHIEVDPPHKICVRDILSHNPYKERVRYFKTVQNATRKLRKDLAEQIDEQSEANSADYIIQHDIDEALSELEKEKCDE